MGFPPVVVSRGCSPVLRLLIAVASLSGRGLQAVGASVVSALELRSAGSVGHMGLVAPWPVGSSGPGIEPVSPALTGRFFTTEPPGMPCNSENS